MMDHAWKRTQNPGWTAGLAALAMGGLSLSAAGALPQPADAYLQQHCVKCHNADKHKGDLSLAGLDQNLGGKDAEKWKKVAEKIATGEMPPESQPRPSPHAAGQALSAMKTAFQQAGIETGDIGQKLRLPQHGNRIDHDTLFDAGSKAVAASPIRLWRASPQIYSAFATRISKNTKVAQPFSAASAGGFKDYADLFVIDEPTVQQLFRNAQAIVDVQTAAKNSQKELAAIVDGSPSRPQVEAAIRREFQLVLRRDPSADEMKRFTALHDKNVADAGQAVGARATLATVFLLPEALYRLEIGQGEPDAQGRQMLAPRELAAAIAYAIGDEGPDTELLKAAEGGRLSTKQDVQREVARLLSEPKFGKQRTLRFFEEYFEYPSAADVFKDLNRGEWRPEILINDTRRLIQWVLDQDKDVLKTLLTTNKSFVNYQVDNKGKATPVRIANKKDDKPKDPKRAPKPRQMEYSDLYGLPPDWEWTADQPIDLPASERAGVLTQPSWLAAFATNNETHAIRRGKWVRERLLGGAVPDLPITVDAKLPDAPDKTMRQRMEVTRQEYCWQCHQKMNPVGLTFESFDFLGRFRTTEPVVDLEATAAAAKTAKKNDVPRPVIHEVPLDSTGLLDGVGDPKIDGPVTDAVQMIRKLAETPRVRQVFVRHAFRYWMGRNETPDDAPTLVAADLAYVQSGGSMKALIASLLTSDSFLYRKAAE